MPTDPLLTRQYAVSAQIFADEGEVLRKLCDAAPRYSKLQPAIFAQAKTLVEKLRKDGAGHGVEAFLQQYGLDTQEGIAIMCLAEALLRIPDDHTADELIRDKFEGRGWDKHINQSESLFVNASSWGLMLTGKMMDFSAPAQAKPSAILKKLVGRVGEPVVREALKTAVKFIGTQFVMGTNIREAMSKARSAEKKGYQLSYDILGEGARTEAQAKAYFEAYLDAIKAIGEAKTSKLPSLSIKLSALHPKYYLQKEERVTGELYPRLKALCLAARDAKLMVAIDAEESYRLDTHMMLYRMLLEDPDFKGYDGLGFVMQGYQKRAHQVAEWLAELAKATGHKIPVRLVKGAYWDTEIKLSQVMGYPAYPVFTRKAATDVSYLACAEKLLSHRELFFPQFATHNAYTLAAIRHIATDAGWQLGEYEFQRLHGMGEKLYDQLIGEIPCRIYAPVGEYQDLLAYLIRRLLENGANTSFVNQLMDHSVTVEELLADPIAKTRARGFANATDLPLPAAIYGDRKNSGGFDFGNLDDRKKFMDALTPHLNKSWEAGDKTGSESKPVTSPTDNAVVGTVHQASPMKMENMMSRAQKAFASWTATSVNDRAAMLESAAELFEANQFELMAICVREAGKTLNDAVAEIREAIDFLRYYAMHSRKLMAPEALTGPTGESNTLHLHGRGVFVCISPWNFPLAIFTGQVAAALVTGNCVLAKPADQTPLIAARAVQLLHQAGIPQDVLQLVPGRGSVVGEALLKHAGTAGVCFTGSVPTALHINRTLAARDGAIVPLIAETGGQNCMVVDSTALIEQAVDDILLSAFGSAGQRCSALRVLYVQEEIADHLIEMLKAAMSELKIGNPAEFSTDIGPVIDDKARAGLQKHIDEMMKTAKFIAKIDAPNQGSFLSPHAFEINDISELTEEHFGPILHIIRFKAAELPSLPAKINATGFGLTFGLHSRIEEHWQLFQSQIKAGNCYINRSMIGATVGVQPFGGEGLSGTGPKAGGPHYLTRFCLERTVTINTAAIGGNLELLAG